MNSQQRGEIYMQGSHLVFWKSSYQIPDTEEEQATAPSILPPANLPLPKPLVVDENLSTNCKQWKKVRQRYEIAAGIYKQADLVQVSTLLLVIEKDTIKAFDTFTWGEDEQNESMQYILAKFVEYWEPSTQVIYERYHLNNRKVEAGESIATYVTELCMIAKTCSHGGIRDENVHERLI